MNNKRTSPRRPLLIVESPNKVKTIEKILGADFNVQSSFGHFADIPAKKGAVDVNAGFTAAYQLSQKGAEVIEDLRRHMKDASEIILATDDDREGEMIAALLLEFLQPTIPVSRIVFRAITQTEVRSAIEDRRQIRTSLVEAARTRRYLDHLYGFTVSPVLWSNVRQNLSAGRVKSPALRMIVEREEARLAFIQTTYCGIEVSLTADADVVATLRSINDVPVAKSSDIDDAGVVAPPTELLLKDAAENLATQLAPASLTVVNSESERYTRRPRPPYTTSSLLHDCVTRLNVSASAAQSMLNQLHEKGLISYPRTDSPSLSPVTTEAARQHVVQMFGASLVPVKPRIYTAKRQSAQEAHEAIRPANVGVQHPKGLNATQAAIYDLVWRRTLASQMIDTTGTTVTVTFETAVNNRETYCRFTASGTTITELGHRRLFVSPDDVVETPLASFTVGDVYTVASVDVKEHTTRPPARYTEATLIQALEEKEIGRPSTYATIIRELGDEYVWSKRGDQALIPTLTGVAVHEFMRKCFPALIDFEFTRDMEEALSAIVDGESTLEDVLRSFYFDGDDMWPGLLKAIDHVASSYVPADNYVRLIGVHPESGEPIVLKPGRTFAGKKAARTTRSRRGNTSGSPYLSCGGRNMGVPDHTELADLTVEYALARLNAPDETRVLGTIDGDEVTVKVGPHGPYIKVGKRNISLPDGMAPADITLDDVAPLLEYPKVLGTDPESGVEIVLKRGRYGFYVDKDGDTRPLPKDSDPGVVTMSDAIALLAAPKKRRGKR